MKNPTQDRGDGYGQGKEKSEIQETRPCITPAESTTTDNSLAGRSGGLFSFPPPPHAQNLRRRFRHWLVRWMDFSDFVKRDRAPDDTLH